MAKELPLLRAALNSMTSAKGTTRLEKQCSTSRNEGMPDKIGIVNQERKRGGGTSRLGPGTFPLVVGLAGGDVCLNRVHPSLLQISLQKVNGAAMPAASGILCNICSWEAKTGCNEHDRCM